MRLNWRCWKLILIYAVVQSSGTPVRLSAQQLPDSTFAPVIESPAYATGAGPVVLVDEAHNNFHTAGGRYFPFASLLRRDGYVVQPLADSLSAESLSRGEILVIANARYRRVMAPGGGVHQGFMSEEIDAVRDWVVSGGALFLIMDHAPFDAAIPLAREFGIRFRSGAAVIPGNRSGRLVFRREDGTLADHPLTRGISQIGTFTGTSFELEGNGSPLLRFGPEVYSYSSGGDSVSVAGHLQGAVLTVNRGKVAVFGEAAMFSAQLSGPDRNPMGMNAEIARENPLLLRRVLRWLSSRD